MSTKQTPLRRVGRWPLNMGLFLGAVSVLGCMDAADSDSSVRAVEVSQTPASAEGQTLELRLEAPSVQPVQGPDGAFYSRLTLPGCESDNAVGLPSLPVIRQTVEVPLGVETRVQVELQDVQQLALEHALAPYQQANVTDLRTLSAQDFAIDRQYYAQSDASEFRAALAGAEPALRSFERDGHKYVTVELRPFRYNAASNTVRYPQQIRLHLHYVLNVLPKAAGPRKGPISIVELKVQDGAEIKRLSSLGYDLANRKGNTVTVYATDQELSSLQAAGYSPRLVDSQPRAPRERDKFGAGFGSYHSFATLSRDVRALAAAFPSLCQLSTVGTSGEGRPLWALKITDHPEVQEDEPEVLYISTIHGDEIIGVENTLHFADTLLRGYDNDPRITNLIDNTEIWLVPLMNPDGFEAGTRYNADGFDLNRSFPEGSETPLGNILSGPAMSMSGRPTEVMAMMRWRAQHSFTLSANFHAGAVVANYPYDDDGRGSVDSPSPDDALFESISLTYAKRNLPMWNSSEFTHGITNGAEWYVVEGGMQDWSYRYLGTNEVTLELSDDKQPPSSQIAQFWQDNQEAMLAYFETVHSGIRGLVTDSASGAPVFASVTIASNSHLVFTDPDVGDYHRMLLPGTYTVTFSAPGYQSKTVSNVTVPSSGGAVRLDTTLHH